VTEALERLTNLVALLLETRRPLSLDEINSELAGQYPPVPETRRRAFERDKAVLRDEGIPIEQVVLSGDRAGATGYWIERERFELPDLGLTEEEKRALQVAVAAVRISAEWAGAAMQKVAAPAGRDGTPVDGPAAGGGPLAAALPSLDALPSLFEANTSRASAQFDYRGRRRILDPYGLLSREGRWYVVGHDHEAGEMRTYRVDRIDGQVTVGVPGAFDVPDDFDPASAFPADAKLVGEGVLVDAGVWVSAARAQAVTEELGEAAVVERRDDGSIVVAVPFANAWAFRSWALGLLDDAEVLSPSDVRAETAAWLAEIAEPGT
jgi:predicted DNA-binding transcriptional regulator YafY